MEQLRAVAEGAAMDRAKVRQKVRLVAVEPLKLPFPCRRTAVS